MAYITLLSDLGLQDASVAVARGILSQYAGGVAIIDISHEVTPFHTGQAAYLLSSAYSSFKTGSCHIVLSDLFSRADPKLVLGCYNGHNFLSADNGTLPLALGQVDIPSAVLYDLKKEEGFMQFLHECGRRLSDVLNSSIPLSTNSMLAPAPMMYLPVIDRDYIECDIIHIDRFENVVVNVTKQQFENARQSRQFSLQFMEVEEITELSQNYYDVKTGFKLCRFNGNDHLEISINKGKAASLFGLRLGSRHNGLKIVFE